jgi:hypothetical protein
MPLKVIKSRAVRVTANGKICSRNPKKKNASFRKTKKTWKKRGHNITSSKKHKKVMRGSPRDPGSVRLRNAKRKPKRIAKAKKRSTKRKVAKR